MNLRLRPVLCFSVLLALLNGRAAADTVISYPTIEEAGFTITVPDDWELTRAEDVGDFFLVSGPTNAALWFRGTRIGAKGETVEAVKKAYADGIEWLGEDYRITEFGEATEGELRGMPFISFPGKGVRKETGKKVVFTLGFAMMRNGWIAEFWGIFPSGDADGQATAKAIVTSIEEQ